MSLEVFSVRMKDVRLCSALQTLRILSRSRKDENTRPSFVKFHQCSVHTYCRKKQNLLDVKNIRKDWRVRSYCSDSESRPINPVASGQLRVLYVDTLALSKKFQEKENKKVDTDEVEELPSLQLLKWADARNIVVFDLETTGLERNSDITQISAIHKDQVFNRYVLPNKEISPGASDVTGLTKVNNELLLHGQPIPFDSIDKAMLDFLEYLRQIDKPLLIGHNIKKFDVPVLHNSLKSLNLTAEFNTVVWGFADTLLIARKAYPKLEGGYSQQNLVKCLLSKEYDAHNALADVQALQELFVEKLQEFRAFTEIFPLNRKELLASYESIISANVISQKTANRLACAGIHFRNIQLAYQRDKYQGIQLLLKKDFGNFLSIRTVQKLTDHISRDDKTENTL